MYHYKCLNNVDIIVKTMFKIQQKRTVMFLLSYGTKFICSNKLIQITNKEIEVKWTILRAENPKRVSKLTLI